MRDLFLKKSLEHSLIKFYMEIRGDSRHITGISNEDVAGQPVFKTVSQEVLDFIGDADLAGFNVERFDLPLLEREIVARDAGYIQYLLTTDFDEKVKNMLQEALAGKFPEPSAERPKKG
jgi:DNA polymerase III epsilon subunit-like protein